MASVADTALNHHSLTHCTFCLETLGKFYVEDEFHMLFVCYLYGELRGKFLPKWCLSYPNERKMLRLMSHSSPAIVIE